MQKIYFYMSALAAIYVLCRILEYHLMAEFAAKGSVWWLRHLQDGNTLGKKRRNRGSGEKREREMLDEHAEEDACWLESQTSISLEIKAFDGVCLKGRYIKAGKSERLAVFFHGWRSTWARDGGSICRWLLSEHCDVLCVDQRSQGLSGGEYMGLGVLESRDCLAWTQFLAKRGNKLPTYLVGVSMGASTVLMAAGETQPDFVKGIWGDCGFSSPYDMLNYYGRKHFATKEHPAMDYVNHLIKAKAHYSLKEYSAAEALKKSRLPVLLVHGTADGFVPCYMSGESYEACASEKRLLLVEGAAHARSFLKDREVYIRTVKDFFHWS